MMKKKKKKKTNLHQYVATEQKLTKIDRVA